MEINGQEWSDATLLRQTGYADTGSRIAEAESTDIRAELPDPVLTAQHRIVGRHLL